MSSLRDICAGAACKEISINGVSTVRRRFEDQTPSPGVLLSLFFFPELFKFEERSIGLYDFSAGEVHGRQACLRERRGLRCPIGRSIPIDNLIID